MKLNDIASFKLGDNIIIKKGALIIGYLDNKIATRNIETRISGFTVLKPYDFLYSYLDLFNEKLGKYGYKFVSSYDIWAKSNDRFHVKYKGSFLSEHYFAKEIEKTPEYQDINRIILKDIGSYDAVFYGKDDNKVLLKDISLNHSVKEKASKVSIKDRLIFDSEWELTNQTPIKIYSDYYRDSDRTEHDNLYIFTLPTGIKFKVVNKTHPVSRAGTLVVTDLDFNLATNINPEFDITLDNWRSPFKTNAGFGLPIKQIEPYLKAIHIPETVNYVLKDSETGMYFNGFIDDYVNKEFKPIMVKSIKSAKKYVSISAVKASIASWTGKITPEQDMQIYNSTGYNIGTEKKMDLPDSWVIMPFDKASKKEIDKPIKIN